MNAKSLTTITLGCTLALLVASATGQVVRETGTNSIAGLLDTYNPADSFSFSSQGNEVLFADVDAEIYQVQGRRGGSHDDDEGGCGSHDTAAITTSANDGHDDHEASGGPGGLCLQVFDAAGTMICWADRPARPGWQRDPALACPLPSARGAASYELRISVKTGGCGPGGHDGHEPVFAAAPTDGPGIPYLINWSLRRISSDGPLLSQSNRGRP